MAESPEGVAIQIYSALIAALMLQLLTGKRPGKRAMELIRLYLEAVSKVRTHGSPQITLRDNAP